ncbi:cytochrome c [Mesorhizobium sp. YM1C-6-2]|uniref:c-type cytochrome n=1 Tax=Mesorhizobium sp. YM1C-6-2 TaxID=1827501 RepID=UPI000EF262E7|nr:cytochrome c [Mesorhizobium sp. YM1C-6-2]RLP23104.1 cytochrome c [Mesorhizobium sp. YM1C-6-2]
MSRTMVGMAWLAMLMALDSASAQTDGIAEGKALVELNCARCHAIDRTSKSDHADAPPFRTLSQRYPIDALEEAFAEGISTGHPDMPEFVATPGQIGAILDYISSLND